MWGTLVKIYCIKTYLKQVYNYKNYSKEISVTNLVRLAEKGFPNVRDISVDLA